MTETRVVRAGEGETFGPQVFFKEGSRTGAPFDFIVMDVGYLRGPPLHVHQEQYETFYVLEGGVLTVQIGDELVDLKPGDYATAPPGVPHTFDNTREDQPSVKMCSVVVPGGFDEFLGTANAQNAWKDPAKIAAIAAKHGISFVGPPLAAKLGLTK